MRTGSEGESVANESGLRALGARIDSQRAKPKGVRRSGKAKWSVRKKVVLSLCALVVLIAAVAGGSYAYLQYRYDQINKVHIDAEVAAANGGPFTILVIGSDSRVGEGTAFGSASVVTGQRSDVVQLWRVTPSTKQIQILSIPRDTVVSMLGSDVSQFGTYNRINSSYNSGANQLVQTITANFGIPINHVVQVDFAGFQDSVNTLGGIYLNFAYPAKDAYSGLNITAPGCQLLNGTQALAVARSRHYYYYQDGEWQYDGTSDFGRIQRQDAFLKALISAAKSKVSPLTVNAFIGSIHEGVIIDDGFSLNELIGLALTYHSFDPNSLQTQTLPTVSSDAFGGLGDVLTIDQPAAQQMLVNIFGSSLIAPTNPPPDANGYPEPPPTITPTTVAPATPSTSSTPRACRHDHSDDCAAALVRPDALHPELTHAGRRRVGPYGGVSRSETVLSGWRQGRGRIAGRCRSRHSRVARHAGVAAMTICSLLAVGARATTAADTPRTRLSVSTNELDFGQQTLGVDSGSLTFTLTNNGTSTDSIDPRYVDLHGTRRQQLLLPGQPGVRWRRWPKDHASERGELSDRRVFLPHGFRPRKLPTTVIIQGSTDTSGVSAEPRQAKAGLSATPGRCPGCSRHAGNTANFGDSARRRTSVRPLWG